MQVKRRKAELKAKDILKKRTNKDRRKAFSLPPLKFFLVGKRKKSRRKTDGDANYFVDTHSPIIVILVTLITIMSFFDWGMTLIHLEKGATEANPIMDLAIKKGEVFFFLIKYLLTTTGLFILCLFKDFIPAKKILFFVLIGYISLMVYHVRFFFI